MIKREDLKVGLIIKDFELDYIIKINTRNVHFMRLFYDWLPIDSYLQVTNDYAGFIYTDIFCEE